MQEGAMSVSTWGDRSAGAIAACMTKRIEVVRMFDETLRLVFEDGTELCFADRGQNCCEHRYMTCDDDLVGWTGAKFVGVDLLEAPNGNNGDVHEVQFLHVRTDMGTLTCQTHNEHNGYYGGFSVEVWIV
jgi:hypothetical protein